MSPELHIGHLTMMTGEEETESKPSKVTQTKTPIMIWYSVNERNKDIVLVRAQFLLFYEYFMMLLHPLAIAPLSLYKKTGVFP